MKSNALPLQKTHTFKSHQSYQDKIKQQKQQLRHAAQLYEKQFLGEMVKAMRKTVNTRDSVIQKSFAEKLYEGQLDEKYVDSWAKTGGVGLTNLIYDQLMERYFSNTFQTKPQGPMPLNKKIEVKAYSVPETEIESKKSNGKTFHIQPEVINEKSDVKSPWKGEVQQKYKTPDGKSVIEIQHNKEKVLSKIVFPGDLLALKVGESIDAGQKMGNYNPSLGVMAWNIRQI